MNDIGKNKNTSLFFLFFFWLGKNFTNLTLLQAKLTEESKKMVQDTTTRLEKAVEVLVVVIVRPLYLVICFLRVG